MLAVAVALISCIVAAFSPLLVCTLTSDSWFTSLGKLVSPSISPAQPTTYYYYVYVVYPAAPTEALLTVFYYFGAPALRPKRDLGVSLKSTTATCCYC